MEYRHSQVYGGRIPAGQPAPELIETEFGTAIVYANEYGNVVAQTADPAKPLVNGGCGFDVAIEVCWDGSGTRSGPSDCISQPDHMRSDTVHRHMEPIYESLSKLIAPYAAKHDVELRHLAYKDATQRMEDLSRRMAGLGEQFLDGTVPRPWVPFVRQLPIGPVLVTLPSPDAFVVEGHGYGGTCEVNGRTVMYKATLPLSSSNKTPYVTMRSLTSSEPLYRVSDEHIEMLRSLRDALSEEYAPDIAYAREAAQTARIAKELESAKAAHRELSEKRDLLFDFSLVADAAPTP